MCRGKMIIIMGALLALVVMTEARADRLKVDFDGVVTAISRPDSGAFSVGAPISYSFTFNETLNWTGAGTVRHSSTIVSFEGSVGGYEFNGSTGSIFIRNDAPYDQITIENFNLITNEQALGISRDDFDFTSGNIDGYPLRSLTMHVQTDDLNFLKSRNFDATALQAMAASSGGVNFQMTFMDGAFGVAGLVVLGVIENINWNSAVCTPDEMTDIYALELDLIWTPDSPYGDSEFGLYFGNNGPNAYMFPETRRLIGNLYELDNNLERSRLVVSRSPPNMPPGLASGTGGSNSTIVQGKAYEFEVVYPCDTNPDNNNLFRIAHTANPAYVIFRDSMEGSPLPPVPGEASGNDHAFQ